MSHQFYDPDELKGCGAASGGKRYATQNGGRISEYRMRRAAPPRHFFMDERQS
jgi:hypothetical protein